MAAYKPTIGLEIHTILKTQTKMFCGCLNVPDEKQPNANICPICMAHPGTLPTINKEAVEKVIKLGIALNSQIAEVSKFDRKNYFYPDLPKAYQLSQYDQPLVSGGELNGIRLRRIHLEEDAARLLHDEKIKSTLVDFNRAGVPLMELVTEPDVTNGKQATDFAKELQLIMRYLGISDADMEKGHMRIEANLSLSADEKLGTKVEVKNLNSFKAVGDAIDYEIKRQTEFLDKGEKIIQETRGWDDKNKKTVSQRLKEEAHDYRYFPEPDLPSLNIKELFDSEKIKMEMPELPAQKRERFAKQYGLNKDQSGMLVENKLMAGYFEESASELEELAPGANFQSLFNYLTSDLKGLMKEGEVDFGEKLKISPEYFARLIFLISKNELNSRMTKDILAEMFKTGLNPEDVIKLKGLDETVSEKSLSEIIDSVISENPKAIEDYKKGQENVIQFLIGKAMQKLKGRGNPDQLRDLFKGEIK